MAIHSQEGDEYLLRCYDTLADAHYSAQMVVRQIIAVAREQPPHSTQRGEVVYAAQLCDQLSLHIPPNSPNSHETVSLSYSEREVLL